MACSFSAERLLLKNVSNYEMELQAAEQININIDLVSAAKRHLNLLRIVSGLPHLHGGPLLSQAIRRYRDCWMPLAAKFTVPGETNQKWLDQILLPPLDVQWVWHCHCLNPKSYLQFCKLHYSKIIDVPLLPDVSSELSAKERCRNIWSKNYPNEPFDLEVLRHQTSENHADQGFELNQIHKGEDCDLVAAVSRQSSFYFQVSQPYMWQDSFLKTAKERYKCFLYMLQKSEGKSICIPTSDIHLMWQSHKVSPVSYAQDTKALSGFVEDHDLILERPLDGTLLNAFENTSRIWETFFGHPYERAGSVYQRVQLVETLSPLEAFSESIPVTINWQHQDIDINLKHDSLHPRYVVEVCIQIKTTESVDNFGEEGDLFVRLRAIEAYKLLKLDAQLPAYGHDMAWHKIWLMQCEMSTQGVILELRSPVKGCLRALGCSTLLGQTTLTWEELGRAPLLALDKTFVLKKRAKLGDNWTKKLQFCISASITPPVQAPYLLKSLPDRVTDDSGAMLSKLILRMNKYQPQQGRWTSRTVLDHRGKECFVIRIRVARGIWRRKTDRPVGVDWNERIIHIHEGGWTYVTGSIGIAPEKIVATATPVADELEQYRMKWSFSSGETLTIQMPIEEMEWERHLRFTLKGSHPGLVRLLNGRKMQYQVPSAVPEEEEGFVTLVRYTAEAPQGKATALFNWKVSAMEVLPEEDAVLVMLLSTTTLMTVADLGGKTLGNFFTRSKRGSKPGQRDLGAVVMGGGPETPSKLMFWFLNPEEVLGVSTSDENYEGVHPTGSNDQMYRGTSWLDSGGTGGLYKMSSRGSWESFGRDGGDHLFGGARGRFGSQTKVLGPR